MRTQSISISGCGVPIGLLAFFRLFGQNFGRRTQKKPNVSLVSFLSKESWKEVEVFFSFVFFPARVQIQKEIISVLKRESHAAFAKRDIGIYSDMIDL